MKMTITFDVDVDEREWAEQFPEDMSDLAANATRYARNVVESLWTDLGLIGQEGGQ